MGVGFGGPWRGCRLLRGCFLPLDELLERREGQTLGNLVADADLGQALDFGSVLGVAPEGVLVGELLLVLAEQYLKFFSGELLVDVVFGFGFLEVRIGSLKAALLGFAGAAPRK